MKRRIWRVLFCLWGLATSLLFLAAFLHDGNSSLAQIVRFSGDIGLHTGAIEQPRDTLEKGVGYRQVLLENKEIQPLDLLAVEPEDTLENEVKWRQVLLKNKGRRPSDWLMIGPRNAPENERRQHQVLLESKKRRPSDLLVPVFENRRPVTLKQEFIWPTTSSERESPDLKVNGMKQPPGLVHEERLQPDALGNGARQPQDSQGQYVEQPSKSRRKRKRKKLSSDSAVNGTLSNQDSQVNYKVNQLPDSLEINGLKKPKFLTNVEKESINPPESPDRRHPSIRAAAFNETLQLQFDHEQALVPVSLARVGLVAGQKKLRRKQIPIQHDVASNLENVTFNVIVNNATFSVSFNNATDARSNLFIRRTKPTLGTTPSGAEGDIGWDRYLQYELKDKRIWPVLEEQDDRVLAQILHKHDYKFGKRLKRIYVSTGLSNGQIAGQSQFINHDCPVNQCSLTEKPEHAATADVILFKDFVRRPSYPRPPNQIWIMFMLESPYHTYSDDSTNGQINWTATYRTDSILVTPYERFTYFANFTGLPDKPSRNYAEGKTKKVAWFVSNCYAPNGREHYVRELRKYIDVDIFGSCGSLQCSRMNDGCNEMLRKDYKFYLSFENSNCKDYITEKLYWNALKNDVVPVVMGARPQDYLRLAPKKSFIHVDRFSSPKNLARYLHMLDKNDTLYNAYFRWKGTGEYIDTKFWCRLCILVHEAAEGRVHWSYPYFTDWWRGPGVCVDAPQDGWSSWRKAEKKFNYAATFPKTWSEA